MAAESHRLGRSGASRACACGCGVSLAGYRRDARYAHSGCRARAARIKADPQGAEAQAVRRARRGSEQAADIADRRASGSIPSDQRIQYRRAVNAVTGLLRDHGWAEDAARADAEAALRTVLPARHQEAA